jgi:hypothetical protein
VDSNAPPLFKLYCQFIFYAWYLIFKM